MHYPCEFSLDCELIDIAQALPETGITVLLS